MKKILPLVASAMMLTIPATSAFAQKDMPGMMGEHEMTGTVSQLDQKTGTLSLQTKGLPTMRLHFPPDQLKDVKNGDTITVHLGFTKEAGGQKK